MAKRLYSLLLLFFVALVSAQVPGEKFTYKPLGWTIELPKGYSLISEEEGQRVQDKGVKMIEATYDTDLEDVLEPTTTLFMLKNGPTNYMEANLQAFDPAKDGDFNEVNREVSGIILQTFKDQMPKAAKVEMSVSNEVVGGKKFFVAHYIIMLPGSIKLDMFMYSRLFAKKNLTINIMYLDNEQGKILMNSLRSSVFK